MCPFARVSQLLGSPEWDPRRSFDANVLMSVKTLQILANANLKEDPPSAPPDGFVLAVPICHALGIPSCASPFFTVRDLGRLVGQVICVLCTSDGTSIESVRELMERQQDDKWRFSIGGCGMFISVFAPCYPRESSRHQFGEHPDHFFILFQPDVIFSRHKVTNATLERTQARFTDNGQRYKPDHNAVVKPLNEFNDPPLKWWQIGTPENHYDIAEIPPPVAQLPLPIVPAEWNPPPLLCRVALKVSEYVFEKWESSLDVLGPIESWEYNTGLELGCPSVLLFLKSFLASGTRYCELPEKNPFSSSSSQFF